MQIQNGSRSWTWELRPPRVLIAESDDSSRAEVCRVLAADGYDVVEAHSGEEVLDSILAFPAGPTDCIDVIVVSCRLTDCDGEEVRARVQRMHIETPFVVLGDNDLDRMKGEVHRLTHDF